jgi:hypothetical protein
VAEQCLPDHHAIAERLLNDVGLVEWLPHEALIDAATALSGSGPAYVFYITECLAKAGVNAGLPRDTAARLARATVQGAGAVLAEIAEEPERFAPTGQFARRDHRGRPRDPNGGRVPAIALRCHPGRGCATIPRVGIPSASVT